MGAGRLFLESTQKRSTFLCAPQKPKKIPGAASLSLLVAGGPDRVIRRLFEMGKECAGLRHVGLEAQRLFELRIGLRRALMRGGRSCRGSHGRVDEIGASRRTHKGDAAPISMN